MQTPPEISFIGFDPNEGLKVLVAQQIARLEKHSDRITTLRVAVDARHQKGRKGHVYDVRIDIGVPGSDLAVNHGPGSNDRKEDLVATVRDAFKAAKRQLDDWSAKQRVQDTKRRAEEEDEV
jgi:ribosome-associated translation inhibitor RaiA